MANKGQVQHNTQVDALGKDYEKSRKDIKNPRMALGRDRAQNAKRVTDSVSEWKKKPNMIDLKGFDTKDMKERVARTLAYDDGIGYVAQEPDRFMRYDQQSFRLLERRKNDFYDYESFKKMVDQQWGQDNSLSNLLKKERGMRENDYQALFNHEIVRTWLNQNIEGVAIPILQRRYNIEADRAKALWDRLPQQRRGQLVTRLMSGKRGYGLPPKQPVIDLRTGRVKIIRQKAASGKTYKRAKPSRWNEEQVSFLRNNRDKPTKWLTEMYNRVFTERYRTASAISSKRYRL